MPGRGYGVRIEQPSLASDRETLIGYPVRITASVEPGRIHLSCETDLEASVRHITEKGGTVNVVKPAPLLPLVAPAPAPTLKALIRHWVNKGRGR